MYQPESDDECRARAGEGNAAASARDRQEEEGGGCDDSDSVSEDVSEDVAAAIETDHRRPSSPSESVSAEEVLESEAAQEYEQKEES